MQALLRAATFGLTWLVSTVAMAEPPKPSRAEDPMYDPPSAPEPPDRPERTQPPPSRADDPMYEPVEPSPSRAGTTSTGAHLPPLDESRPEPSPEDSLP